MTNTKMNFFSFSLYLVLLFTISLNFLLASGTIPDIVPTSAPTSSTMYIVYTDSPQNEDPKDHHIQILVSVLGSEEAARDALVYSFKSSVSGFAAKLTPNQFEKISKQPGVINVAQSINSYNFQSSEERLA